MSQLVIVIMCIFILSIGLVRAMLYYISTTTCINWTVGQPSNYKFLNIV